LEEKEQEKKAKSALKLAGKKFFKAETYLSANAFDSALVTEMTGIKEQVKNLGISIKSILEIKDRVQEFKKQLAADIVLHKKRETLCSKLKKKHEAQEKLMSGTGRAIEKLLEGRLMLELRVQYDGLLREMAYLRKIAGLEQERVKLKDGKACPLCGSLHHPFAEGNVPEIDEIEEKINDLSRLIKKVENLENDLKKYESNEKAAALTLVEAKKKRALALQRKDELLENVRRTEKDLEKAIKISGDLKKALALKLEPFGMGKIPGTGLEQISNALSDRQKAWQDHQEEKIKIEKNISELTSKISSIDAILKTLDESLKEKHDFLGARQKDLEKLNFKRHRLYGDKNPDTEEARYETLVFRAEKSEEAARDSRDEVKQQLNDLKTRIAALKKTTVRRKPELDILESRFRAMCKKNGFKDELSFISFRLPLDKRDELNMKALNLNKKRTDIKARKKDRETRLSKETAKKITGMPVDNPEKDQMKIREALKSISQEIGALKQKLLDNTNAKIRLENKKLLIEAREKEWSRWSCLHSLIGSADGKKYRNFAQGITFELMVSHANRQLEKMSDRYLLVRDEKQPLELNIIDNYQAGEIRSTKNLSGGESFIVSLSLALGLSGMASRNVRVDSLFLDEGFGTLDEDALETSLEALAGLHRKGKLIGVISHVPSLKERIATQINITPMSGGKSRITGPGVKGP
ncbi:MAG: chromosome segregation protein SMC, partial [Deltaproteobacteria bacterium]|nr:chromosome segregation protein SMC [Deltaproteobacteria bacterium]